MSFEFEDGLRKLIEDVTRCHNVGNNLHILATNTNMNVKGKCSDELEAELYYALPKFLSRNRIYGEAIEILVKFDWRGNKKIEINEVKDNKPFVLSYRQAQLEL